MKHVKAATFVVCKETHEPLYNSQLKHDFGFKEDPKILHPK